jgi:diketogulonate reductase-like aldo/keto reductase
VGSEGSQRLRSFGRKKPLPQDDEAVTAKPPDPQKRLTPAIPAIAIKLAAMNPANTLMYGTAWKEDATERLTRHAIEAGFRAIDTANQRKHYFEAGVGAAVKSAIADGLVTRNELFLQTKFTSLGGQDDRLPYDRDADPATQVRQSFASSLEHLGVQHIDSYVIHGPSRRRGLTPADLEEWRTLEEIQQSGQCRFIGISNVALDQVEALVNEAKVPPRFVQNRCFAETGWDREVRALCRANGITYQGFSLLTANLHHLRRPGIGKIATRHSKTIAQVVFRFALQVGMLPLTGTTDPTHMSEDLDINDFELGAEEVEVIENIAQ